MSHPYESAVVRIIDWLHHAERDLIGSTVATFNGDAGIVRGVKLDDHHGLCFTFSDDHGPLALTQRFWYPVSTIKFKGPKP